MSMSPSMKLSQFPQVTLNARVSGTGNAMRQSGDVEGVLTPVTPGTPDAVVLRIDNRYSIITPIAAVATATVSPAGLRSSILLPRRGENPMWNAILR